MENLNKALKDVFARFVKEFEDASRRTRVEFMRTAPAGGIIPEEGKIYGKESREKFEVLCQELRQEVRGLIENEKSIVREEATEAPSVEAVNTITLLNMRKNVTQNDIEDLLERYGDNYQAYKAIASIAKENDIRLFRKHPIEGKLDDLEQLERGLTRVMDITGAESGHISPGFVAIMNMTIDAAIPEEE